MDAHPSSHLTFALVLFGVAIALMARTTNPVLRRRLLLTVGVLLAGLALHVSLTWLPGVSWLDTHGPRIEVLIFAVAVAQAFVAVAFNRWTLERGAERAPAIVQDALIWILVVIAALFVFPNSEVLTTSAIVAAVMGFALQETLGNAFAGLAIQIDRPFKVGHWITVGGFEGTVRQITWRATKIWTKAGNMVILPNSLVAREAVNNYSEPLTPTRLFVEVGVGYQVSPNDARTALRAALGQTPSVLPRPAPEVLLWEFADSSLLFRVFFWVADYSTEEEARDEVRTAIYYELRRRNIEIPWPIQIEYQREDPPPVDADARLRRYEQIIGRVPMLAALFVEGRRELAEGATESLFGHGEVIVREGDPGSSMYVLCRGEVRVTIGGGHEVARIRDGGYFGEMSLLTGEPRSATVTANGDCVVLEIPGTRFKEYVAGHPQVIDHLAAAALERRRELDQSRAAAAAVTPEARLSLADRMRRFFGLS